jgi:hypothetical protein
MSLIKSLDTAVETIVQGRLSEMKEQAGCALFRISGILVNAAYLKYASFLGIRDANEFIKGKKQFLCPNGAAAQSPGLR